MSTTIQNTICKMVDLTMTFHCLKLLMIFILLTITLHQLVSLPKVTTISGHPTFTRLGQISRTVTLSTGFRYKYS